MALTEGVKSGLTMIKEYFGVPGYPVGMEERAELAEGAAREMGYNAVPQPDGSTGYKK